MTFVWGCLTVFAVASLSHFACDAWSSQQKRARHLQYAALKWRAAALNWLNDYDTTKRRLESTEIELRRVIEDRDVWQSSAQAAEGRIRELKNERV